MKRIVLFCLFISVFLGFLMAGPFGIDMGQSLETLKKNGLEPMPIENKPGYYYVTPKKTHPEFESYLVRVDDEEGVFYIKGIGVDIQDNGYGRKTKSRFDDLRKSIEGAYGPSELVTILLPGSIWDELDDWLMSLRQGDRIHLANWVKDDETTFPGNIAEIYLAADALSSSKGYLSIDYYSDRHEALSDKADQLAAQVF